MISIEASKKDFEQFKRDIRSLRLTDRQKEKIILWTLRAIKRKSERNIKSEVTPDGTSWKKRKNPREDRTNQKLLIRVLKYASILVEERGKGRIRYQNPLTGEIALRQQEGFTQIFKIGFATDKNKADQAGNKPATPRQAKRLRELGYRKRNGKAKNGKVKYRLYTMAEIRRNLTRTWASMLIRRLEGKETSTKSKKSWNINVPARPFLDTRDEENIKILDEFAEKFLTGKYE